MTLVGDPPSLFSIHRASPVRGLFLGFLIEVRPLPNLFSYFNLVIHPCRVVKLGTVVFQLIEFLRPIYSTWIGCLIFFTQDIDFCFVKCYTNRSEEFWRFVR